MSTITFRCQPNEFAALDAADALAKCNGVPFFVFYDEDRNSYIVSTRRDYGWGSFYDTEQGFA